jgi:glutathione synthase
MRTDPPVDGEYLYDTQVLALAQDAGVLVVNDPRGLRDLNEKLATLLFPHCCPPTRVARDPAELRAFVDEQGQVVCKPLDGMGGRSIFRTATDDPNLNVILETLTGNGRRMAVAQRYLPEIVDGDKRILLVDGEPVDYCLARIPQGDEFRGNLAAGGRGEGRPLSERDRWIAAQVGPEMKRRGMVFVGLDVIGDYLTEVNVTSPTCIRELDAQFGINIASILFDAIESRVTALAGARNA